MEEEDKDDWHQKKSLCYVFSDVFSRSPNQEFVHNVLAKLYKSKILNKKDVEEKVGNVLLRNTQDESSDSESEDETTLEEKLQHELGGLIYAGLTEKVFKIPEEERLYLLKKRSKIENSHPEEIENEFFLQNCPRTNDKNQPESTNLEMISTVKPKKRNKSRRSEMEEVASAAKEEEKKEESISSPKPVSPKPASLKPIEEGEVSNETPQETSVSAEESTTSPIKEASSDVPVETQPAVEDTKSTDEVVPPVAKEAKQHNSSEQPAPEAMETDAPEPEPNAS